MNSIPSAAITWSFVVCFIAIMVLTILAIFGFGKPPVYLVHVEDRFKKPLFKALILEVIGLALSVVGANLIDARAANARADTAEVSNEMLVAERLTEFVAPGQTTNAQRQAELKQWLSSNKVTNVTVQSFLTEKRYHDLRSRAVLQLVARPATLTGVSANEVRRISEALKPKGVSVATNVQPDGKFMIKVIPQPVRPK
jgi:hypothetical protein